MLAVALLVVGVAGALVRPWDLPAWAVPSGAALLAVGLGAVHRPGTVLRPLVSPILFLLVAVPLAVLLDRLGFFSAAADVAGRGQHLVGGLWVLGAVLTTVLNLDAAVVLLTPLYVQIARRHQLDPLKLAFQPVLLSCLASSALPVSNLTNLIAASTKHLDAADFLSHLALPSLVSTTIGWFIYRRMLHPGTPRRPARAALDLRPLTIGGVTVVAVLLGFVFGPSVGWPEWAVALAADAVLIAVTRSLPWRDVPWGTALVAASLGLLAAGAAAQVDLSSTLSGGSNLDLLRMTTIAAVGANAVNNLPALLVALPHTTTGIWALLLGVNIGPLVFVTGSLAALLWQASLGRLGIRVTAGRFARVGVRVMVPCLLAGYGTLMLTRLVVGD